MENGFSQNCIINSLILLMQNKKYEEITMSDISLKSGVSRRTIYRYFNNKSQILKGYIDALIEEYNSFVKDKIANGKNIVENSFEFAEKYYDFFKVAYKNNLLINIVDILENIVSQVVKYSKTNYFSSLKKDYLDNYISFVASGCWGMLCNWIKSDKKLSPHQMYLHYKQIVKDLHTRLS